MAKTKNKLNHYFVISPEYTYYPLGYYEPPEIARDIVTIWADSPKTAEILAIRSDEFKHWVRDQRSDECCPFTGLEVELTLCKHGNCYCGYCGECEECEKEADAEWEIEKEKRIKEGYTIGDDIEI